MSLWLRLGWREIVRNPRFTALFVVNLALGLAGFLLITAFGGSLARHLDDNLREMLGADLVLRSSRQLSAEEQRLGRTLAGPGAVQAEQLSFYSMGRGPRQAGWPMWWLWTRPTRSTAHSTTPTAWRTRR